MSIITYITDQFYLPYHVAGDEYFVICYRRAGYASYLVLVVQEEATSVTVNFPLHIQDFSINHQGNIYGMIR